MSRQPQQVHIYLYRYNKYHKYEYSIFQRSDNPDWWQGICGGVEEGEDLYAAARREIYEEAGINERLPLFCLDTKSYLPVCIFNNKAQEEWGVETVVVPMYFFAMPYTGVIKLSDEHTQVLWLEFNEAEKLIFFHDQKTGLWELNERLHRNNLER